MDGCYVPGECLDSDTLTVTTAGDPSECLQKCKDYSSGDCFDFTYYADSGVSTLV